MILSIDIGTTAVKILVFDRLGRAVENIRWRSGYTIRTTTGGASEVDADKLLDTVCRGLDTVLAQAGAPANEIAGVASCTFVGNILGVDRTGNASTPIYTYADTRAEASASWLKTVFDEKEIHNRTGCYFHSSYLPARFHWLGQTRPEIIRSSERWLSIGEYLIVKKSPYRLTFLICLAEILGLGSIAVFPALLPTFQSEWNLSNTAAGWISASYYGGYMILVPVLTSITDRVDARRIMGLGALFSALTGIGYAYLASGLWSAIVLRFLSGVSLAAIYMPGLKVVSDHTEGQGTLQSRFISFYTASFSIGASLSYLLAGEINATAGWRWAFLASAISAAAALLIIMGCVPSAQVRVGKPQTLLASFRVVFKSRAAMGYVLAYAAHMWELFSLRSWIVAFMAFSLQLQPDGAWTYSPTRIAFMINLIGLPASIGGNELSRVFGRRRIISIVMVVSAVVGVALGFSAALPYWLVGCMALIYGVTITGDSASLTAGVVAAAPAGYRGTTLAVHSTLGFGSAFLGPMFVGIVLDLFGGGRLAWGMGFLCMAVGCLLGPVFLSRLNSGKM